MWLRGNDCAIAGHAGREMNDPWVEAWTFICESEEAFARIAAKAFSEGYHLYKYRPKYHLGVHMCLEISGNLALNPTSALTRWVHG